MSFEVEVGTIPSDISEFHGKVLLGAPALVIRHPSGPWTTAPYTTPLEDDPRVDLYRTIEFDGIAITVWRDDPQGFDGAGRRVGRNVGTPAMAYYSPDKVDFLAEGDGVTNVENSALYIFPKHRKEHA